MSGRNARGQLFRESRIGYLAVFDTKCEYPTLG
jgi:hypothetical protein